MPLSSGQFVGNRYTIQELLGAGGMGAVYQAWDTPLHARVALKEMVPQRCVSWGLLSEGRLNEAGGGA